MTQTPIGNGKKFVYMTSDGVVYKKTVRGSENMVSQKLAKLRSQVEAYAVCYQETLNDKKLEPEKIEEMTHEWIESTIQYYEINYGDALDSILAYFDFKLERLENKDNVKKKIK